MIGLNAIWKSKLSYYMLPVLFSLQSFVFLHPILALTYSSTLTFWHTSCSSVQGVVCSDSWDLGPFTTRIEDLISLLAPVDRLTSRRRLTGDVEMMINGPNIQTNPSLATDFSKLLRNKVYSAVQEAYISYRVTDDQNYFMFLFLQWAFSIHEDTENYID
jgi:hypothetical protein